MTLAEVEERVAELRRMNADDGPGDNEAAHQFEDRLHLDVLAAIVELSRTDGPAVPLLIQAGDMAREALKTTAIKFTRWYA